MRENTERTEGIDSGSSLLVGVEKQNIIKNTLALLSDDTLYKQMSEVVNPYGEGNSCEIIFDVLKERI